MKYKNRLTLAYYSTKFWDFKSLQSVSKTWKVLKTKNFFKDVQISKYRFLWLPIPISCYFFHKLPASSSVQNIVSRPYFSQNLKISYCKSSFSVHRQILRPTPPSPHKSLTSLFIVKTTWSNNLFQRHDKLFDWAEIEDSIQTWDKNRFT